jgi:multiple sugar transport system permease protein
VATSTTSSRNVQLATQPVPARSWFKSSQRFLGRDWPTAYVFMLPMTLLLFGLIGYPFVRAVYLSFHNAVGRNVGNFVWFNNYVNLWADDNFSRAVSTTIVFTVICVVIKFVLGISTALLLHNVPKWGSVLGGLILLPYIIPEVVKALAWRVLVDPLFGAMNYIMFNTLHIIPAPWPWFGSPTTALPTMIMVYVWSGLPFVIILCLAGLKAVDAEQYDAASVDGATAWRRFLHVTLPGMRYVMIVATLLTTIFTFNSFTLAYLLTQGGPGGATRLYTILAYEYAVSGLRYGAGIAVAMTTAPFLFLLILFLGRYMLNRGDDRGVAEDDGIVWRTAMTILWPVRLVLQGIVALFWLINDAAETALGAASRAVRPAGASPMLSSGASRKVGITILYILLGAVLLFELAPFYFIFITAFKSKLQIQQIQSMFWPSPWTLDNFRSMLFERQFLLWYKNTILVAVVSTTVSLLSASLGAYALVRLKWKGAAPFSTLVLVAYLMPTALMFIPLYYILAQLQLTNTLASLMITYPSVVLPFATWLMMGYYRAIPEELEDAALIDGCGRFGAFFRVVLPLVRPALLAVAMFSVTQSWNEFLYAYMFTTSDTLSTLPVGLGKIIIGDVQPWGELMAAALMTALPVVILYMVGQKFMVAGLTAGSVKG